MSEEVKESQLASLATSKIYLKGRNVSSNMKIQNNTDWDTKLLRTIFAKCRAEIKRREGNRRNFQNMKVSVEKHRSHGWVGGHAPYNSNRLTIKLPPAPTSNWGMDFSQEIAKTFIHEVGHCLGIKKHHGYSTMENLYNDWIFETFSNEKTPILKMAAQPKPEGDIRQVRYQRAQANLKTASTRLKRAETLHKKWSDKVKYYESILN